MKLQVNGAPVEAQVVTLSDFLIAKGLGAAKVATAVNGTFVPASARPSHALSDGDSIEILAPMQGG